MHSSANSEYLDEIVQNLIMGMHISRVPPKCLPFLHEPLLREKQNAIKLGRADIVKKIQEVTKQLDQACIDLKRKTNKKPSRKISNSSFSSISSNSRKKSPDNSNYVRKLLEGQFAELTDPNLISQIIPILKKEKKDAIASGKYHSAKVITDMIAEFKNRSTDSICEGEKVEKYMSLQAQLARAEEELKNTIDYYTYHKQMMKLKHMNAIQKMENLHDEQIIDFEKTWPSELPPSHRKLSKQTLDMRTKENKCLSAEMFDEAEQCRDIADWLEFNDLNEQKLRYELDFNRELLRLKQAQEKELNYIKFRYENKYAELKAEEEREVAKMELIVRNLRRKIEPEDEALLIHDKKFSMGLSDSSETRSKNISASKIVYKNIKPY